MRYTHCSANPNLRCYESNNRTCPLRMRGWLEIVERWALCNRTPRSLDTSAVLGGINPGGSEVAAVRTATICAMFKDPEAVLGWVHAGEKGYGLMSAGVCADLKQGWMRWKEAKERPLLEAEEEGGRV